MGDVARAEFEPQIEYLVTEVETIKILADPLRINILEALVEEALTTKQLALLLNFPQKKLYYHLNLLEEHGLIRVVSTRLVSGITEKSYRSIAKRFSITRSKVAVTTPLSQEEVQQGFEGVLTLYLHNFSYGVRRSIEENLIDLSHRTPDPDALLLKRTIGSLKPEQAREWFQRLKALTAEFETASDQDDSSRQYALSLALHPTWEIAETATT